MARPARAQVTQVCATELVFLYQQQCTGCQAWVDEYGPTGTPTDWFYSSVYGCCNLHYLVWSEDGPCSNSPQSDAAPVSGMRVASDRGLGTPADPPEEMEYRPLPFYVKDCHGSYDLVIAPLSP